MRDQEGEKVICFESDKVCYTEREAGEVLNKAKKHVYGFRHTKTERSIHYYAKDIPRRKYYCKSCGYYHVTHMSKYAGDERVFYREEEFYKEWGKKRARA